MKKKIIIAIITTIIALIGGVSVWYFSFYRPKQQDLAAAENIILGITAQQYKYIFRSDENVYKKCQQITELKKKGVFTTQDIERRDQDCKCTVASVKNMICQFVSETYNDAMDGQFNEIKFETSVNNLKSQSDLLIEIALDGCQMR